MSAPAPGPRRAVCAGEGAVEMLPKMTQDAGPGCRTGTGKTDAVGICGESGFSERWGSRSGCRGQITKGRSLHNFPTSFPYKGLRGTDDSSHQSENDFFFKIDTTCCSAARLIKQSRGRGHRQQGAATAAMLPGRREGMGSRPRAERPAAGRQLRPCPRREGSAGMWGDAGGHASARRATWRLWERREGATGVCDRDEA